MKSNFSFSKSFSLFLALVLSIGTLALSPINAFAEDSATLNLWVGGVQVTKSNANDILGNATASYDYENNLLTLKDANITNGTAIDDIFACIYSDSDLNVALEGNNKIELPDGSISSHGISVNGKLKASGDSLEIRLGKIASTDATVELLESVGVFAAGGISVNKAIIQSLAGDMEVASGIKAESDGVLSFGKIEIKDGGHLIGTGGDVTSEGEWAASFGIEVLGAEDSLVYVLVRDGGLSGTGGDVTTKGVSISTGAYILYGDMGALINDSFMNFVGGKATAVSESGSETAACSNGAYISGGSFGADGGNINFTANECVADVIYGDALKVESKNVKGNPFGGYIAITCEEITLNTHGYGFIGTTVNFKSESGLALNVACGSEIGDNLVISNPENGCVDAGEDTYEWSYFTIIDKDGNEVKEAKIEALTHKVLVNDAERKLSVLVADGQSINDTYCEMMGIESFEDYLKTEKEGFVFEGWYEDEEFTKEFSFDAEITSPLTIYGKWTEVKDVTTPSTPSEPSDDIAKPGDSRKVVFFGVVLFVAFFGLVVVSRKRRA